MNSLKDAASNLAAYFSRPRSSQYQKLEQDGSDDPEAGLQTGSQFRTHGISVPKLGRWSLRGILAVIGGILVVLFLASVGHSHLAQSRQTQEPPSPSPSPSAPAASGEPPSGPNKTLTDPSTVLDANSRRMRIILPADSPGPNLCKTILSLYANGYPAPIIVNWGKDFEKGGDRGFGKSHIGKIAGVFNALDALSSEGAPDDERLLDDDLVLVLDAYDVWMQLPPSALISRYFAHAAAADERVREGWHAGAPGALSPPTQDIVISSQKRCWPTEKDGHHTKCDILPQSDARDDLYGGNTDNPRNLYKVRPRYINSGSIMGSAAGMRRFFAKALRKVENARSKGREVFSDQGVLGEILGEQEAWRKQERGRNKKALEAEGFGGEGRKLQGGIKSSGERIHYGRDEKRGDDQKKDDKKGGDKKDDDKKGDDKKDDKMDGKWDPSYEFGIGLDYLQDLFKPTVFEEEDGEYMRLNDKDLVKDRSVRHSVAPPRISGIPDDMKDLPQPHEIAGVDLEKHKEEKEKEKEKEKDKGKEGKQGKGGQKHDRRAEVKQKAAGDKSDGKKENDDDDDKDEDEDEYKTKDAYDQSLSWGDVRMYTDFWSEAVPVAVHHNAHRNGMKPRRLRDWWQYNWFFPYLREIVETRAPPRRQNDDGDGDGDGVKDGNKRSSRPSQREEAEQSSKDEMFEQSGGWASGASETVEGQAVSEQEEEEETELPLLGEHDGIKYYAPPSDARKPRTRIFDADTLTTDGLEEAEWDTLCKSDGHEKWWDEIFKDDKGWDY